MSEQENAALDKQIRALAHLRPLKTCLESPSTPNHISDKHVDTLNAALDLLAELGENVDEFRMTPGAGFNMGIDKVMEKGLIYAKVAALLEYFTIRQAVLQTADEMQEEPTRMIGFEPPKR